MKLAFTVVLASLLGANAAVAETYYLIDFDTQHAHIVAGSTIKDIGPQQKSADVYEVGFLDADIAKFEFDCAGKRVQVKAEAEYLLQSGQLNQTGTRDGFDWMPVPAKSPIEPIEAFVCSWPKVDPAIENGDYKDDTAMVTSVSETILDTPAK